MVLLYEQTTADWNTTVTDKYPGSYLTDSSVQDKNINQIDLYLSGSCTNPSLKLYELGSSDPTLIGTFPTSPTISGGATWYSFNGTNLTIPVAGAQCFLNYDTESSLKIYGNNSAVTPNEAAALKYNETPPVTSPFGAQTAIKVYQGSAPATTVTLLPPPPAMVRL